MSGPHQPGADSLGLDEESFRQDCELFLRHAHDLHDGWSWEGLSGSDEGYLKKTVLGPRKVNTPNPEEHGRADEDVEGLEEDSVAGGDDIEDGQAVPESPAVVRYEYHVLYSSSFQAPVLYFRATSLDGQPLSLEEMWDNVHPNYQQRLQQGRWDTITQQEHPYLGQPFFILHPCRTQELMSPMQAVASQEGRRLNYVVSWLSAVGPVVGLQLPLSYASVASKPCGMGAHT